MRGLRSDRNLVAMIEEVAPIEEETVNQATQKLAASLAEALKAYAR